MMTTFSPRAPRAMGITAKDVRPMVAMASTSPTACFSFSRFQNIRFRKSPPVSRPLERTHRKLVAVVASSAAGLYSAEQFDLTLENVDKVLDNVRPYLIADGGNVTVVSVADGVVSLKLQGACGSCPSSTTTMKMGIEKVLKEKFGDDLKDICQVPDDQNVVATVEAVNAHLEILRPAIKNYGGSVEAFSVVEGECRVKYVGPDSIGSGIKATIKEKFPDIFNVEFIS